MKFLGMLFFLLTNIAFSHEGGDRVGNGGDVVICHQRADAKIYVLDEYEAVSSVSIGKKNLNYEEKVQILIERVKQDFPLRFRLYSTIFKYYRANVRFGQTPLPEVNDSSSTSTLKCNLVQAAYFRRNSAGQFEYYLQRKVWDKLNEDQKAVLVFHEILYTEAVGLGHLTSYDVRRANRMVFLNNILRGDKFDEAFIAPLSSLRRHKTIILQQLENAYSERIAIYLLKQDLSMLYGTRELNRALANLRKRFKSNILIENLTYLHLGHIEYN